MTTSFQQTVSQNRMRVYVYMALLVALIGGLGSLLSNVLGFGLTGTGISLLLAGFINMIAYFFSDRLVIASTGAKPILSGSIPELENLVRELVIKANLPMPKLYLLNEDAMNAFATGRDQKHAVVAVTRGLLEKLTPKEIQGVIAHELTHIKNGDMLLMSVVSVLVGLASIIADIFWHSNVAGKASEKDTSGAVAIVTMALALFTPLTAFLIQMAVSRSREFMADGGGASLLGEGKPLADALYKISRDRIPLPAVSPATAHLFISSPSLGQSWFEHIFATHPPIDQRIQKLLQVA